MKFKASWTQTYVYSVTVEAADEAQAKKIARRIDHEMSERMIEAADEDDSDDNADLSEPVVVDGVEYEIDMEIEGGISTMKATPVAPKRGAKVAPVSAPKSNKPAGLRLIKVDAT